MRSNDDVGARHGIESVEDLVLNILKLTLAIGIPALLARYVPDRWRIAALLLWLLLPFIIGSVGVLAEMLGQRSAFGDFNNNVQAAMFIGILVGIPWIVASAVGFAIGSVWRRSRQPAAPAPRSPSRAQSAAPEISEDGQWRARYIGFEGDGLVLDGLDVWALKWQRVATSPVELPHPAHPDQRHRFSIHDVSDDLRTTRFAAAELSNGVWGFYSWVATDKPMPSGISSDGSLRFENRLNATAAGSPNGLTTTAFIWDVAKGRLLVDGTAWTSSNVAPQRDGALLLSLRHRDRDALFRLDPAARTFRVLGERRSYERLDLLGEAVDREHAASLDKANTYMGVRLAPDGLLRVDLAAVEWSNSHWVNSPRIMEVATDRIVLDLWNTDWDASISFPVDGCAALDLRRYRGSVHVRVEIDLWRNRYAICRVGSAPMAVGSLANVTAALESIVPLTDATPERAAQGQRRIGSRQVLVAVAILCGALLTIGVVSLVVLKVNPNSPPPLNSIPKMPD